MKLKVRALKYEVDGPFTHIIYVIDNTGRPISAQMCNEHEVKIYLNKLKSKHDISDGGIIYS